MTPTASFMLALRCEDILSRRDQCISQACQAAPSLQKSTVASIHKDSKVYTTGTVSKGCHYLLFHFKM